MDNLEHTHYDAFISYRHSALDSFVATNLHKKLENFKLPKSVMNKVRSGKTRIERVFRDVDELPLSDDLSDPISNALANSDFLITICTPRYPLSKWCLKEIEVFLQTHPRDHVLVVLAEAEPSDSFPEILTYEMVELNDENGIPRLVRKTIEPLAADTRGSNKKEILKAMDTAVIKLAAAIFGLNYDDLRQRHRERAMRKMITIFGIIGTAVMIFAIVVTGMLLKISRQNNVISTQYAELQDKYADEVAKLSAEKYSVGRKAEAIQLARGVLPDKASEGYNANALRSLYKAMDLFRVDETYAPSVSYDMASEVYRFDVSEDGRYILINDLVSLRLFDALTGELIKEFKTEYGSSGDFPLGVFCGNEGVVYTSDRHVMYYDIEGADRTEIGEYEGVCEFFTPDTGDTIMAFFGDEFWGIRSGARIYKFSLTTCFPRAGEQFIISDISFDMDKFVCTCSDLKDNYMICGEVSTGNVTGIFGQGSEDMVVAGIRNGVIYYTLSYYDAGDSSMMANKIYAFDMNETGNLWTADTTGLYFNKIWVSDRYIYADESFALKVYDAKTGKEIASYDVGNDIIKGFILDGCLVYIDYDGRMFRCDGCDHYEITDQYFPEKTGAAITDIQILDKSFFCLFERAGYITRYDCISPDYEETEPDEDIYDTWGEDAYQELMDDEDFDSLLLDYGWHSEDEKYIVAYFSNHILKIIDADTYETVKEYSGFDDYIFSLRYSDVTGSYIMSSADHSYILDDDLDIICDMGPALCDENDCLVVGNQMGEFYMIPWIGYSELIGLADSYINDLPSEDGYELNWNGR